VQTLTYLHSVFRWFVLLSLLFAIFRAGRGVILKSHYTRVDNAIRHWTATIAHIQLMLGIVLYSQSPIVKFFWAHLKEISIVSEGVFFAIIHVSLMFIAIVIISIGSSFAKRKPNDEQKFKTMFVWFLIALLIIVVAIPWPFSPFANRPYFR
jgi:hypothetical protein